MSSRRIYFSIPLAMLVLFFSSGCTNIQKEKIESSQIAGDGVFIHVSHGSEEPHRVLMALSMAEKMAEDKSVLVYFDITGVNVLPKDAEDLTFGDFPSSKTQIAKLLKKRVGLYACPSCLKAADKSAEDLMEGIKIASKEAFFDFAEGRILTLDY